MDCLDLHKSPKEKSKTKSKTKSTMASVPPPLVPQFKNAYLGKKGYTLFKNELDAEQLKEIRDDLLARPYVPKSPQQMSPFKIYRETPDKLFVPRHYGLNRFGPPRRTMIADGETMGDTMEFTGGLRDYQVNIVDKFMVAADKTGGGLLEIDTGLGKCNGINTPIMMYDGTIKMVQDVKVGDILMGDDSTPRNVLTLARGREQMYEVIPHKGDSYTVNESHILSLKWTTSRGKNIKKYAIRDISVLDYLNLSKLYRGWLKGYKVPVVFPKKEVKIDPYILGYWLGDGSSATAQITTEEPEVVNYFKSYAEELNCNLRRGNDTDKCRASLHYTLSGKITDDHKRTPNILLHRLRDYNLIQNKHIPHDYKCNDRTTQLELLAGILDSDGSAMCNGYDLIQKNEKLFDDIIFLVRSLGFAAYKSPCKKSCMYKGEKREGTYYRTFIHGKGLDEIPVKCPRKKVAPRRQTKDALNTGITIKKLEVDDYYGFEIDGNRRFVLGDFTVTHNTVIGIKIASRLRKKTLIIVHKDFLLTQWIERIEQFMPGARVGRIQGPTIDIDGKDIVIAMLQSLSMKQYDPDLFDCFGLTIIDEVHHMGAEVFSQALQKVVTRYVLGLSATMNRKDGLTNVFKMFMGDIVHTEKRDTSEALVNVRMYEYRNSDAEFSEMKYDYRGNPLYSTMIKKLCECDDRSEFLLDIIESNLEEYPELQMMVMAHNKSLLKYLYEGAIKRNIAGGDVGYYLGGMKSAKLKESEDKKLILGTYAMASEGLDIKSLGALVMASPKSDVIQTAGRILRTTDGRKLIVDVVDQHDIFQSQYGKRKAFYRKQKYIMNRVDVGAFRDAKRAGTAVEWETVVGRKKDVTVFDDCLL
jgi:hypothetical protein